MSDYKETTVTGTKWQRASRIYINNPLNGTPTAMISEEEVINIGDNIPPIIRQAADLSIIFDKNNPEHVELYTKLNELYITARDARDAKLIPKAILSEPSSGA